MIQNIDKIRTRLLATAGTAMAVALLSGGASAAETVVIPTAPAAVDTTVTGHDIIDQVATNVADVTAEISDAEGGVGEEVTPTGATTVGVDGNDLHSAALGNKSDNEIDLAAIDNDVDGDGAASLAVEINTGAIGSSVNDSDISVDLDDFNNGSVTLNNNNMDADATGNASSNTLAGVVPVTYAGSTPGSSTVTTGSPWVDAEGSLVASTVQVNSGPVVYAEVDDNDITLDLESTGDNTVTANPEVINNRAAAKAVGNSSNSTIDIQSGGAPVFTGSAVVTNGQTNVADSPDAGDIVAYSETYINADIDADDVNNDLNTLNGSLIVADNTISTSASGNEALGAALGEEGNRVLLADGMSFQGLDTVGASVDTAYSTLDLDSTVSADVIIHSNQGNVGFLNDDRLLIQAYKYDDEIYGEVQALQTGSLTVSGNAVTATARGNAASSAFETGSSTPYFNGTVAVANQQTDVYTDVEAYTEYAEVSAYTSYGDAADVLSDSSVTVDLNRIATSAYGNQVSQSITLEATDMDLPLDAVTLTGGTGPDGNVLADGNVLVTNLQSQYSSDVSSEIDESEIYAYSGEDIYTSSVTVTGNTQEAVALGNSGSNGLSISGVAIGAGAGISSVQIVADDSSVEAYNDAETYISTNDSGDIFDSTLEVSNNLERAIAYGSSAGNTLTIGAESLFVDESAGGIASTVTHNAGATDGFVLDFTGAPQVDAAFGLLNIQSVSASVTAEMEGDTGIYVDNVEGSTLINDNNAAVAAAYGTDSTNRASLDVGNLTSTDDDFVSVANLTNAQTVTEDSSILAEASYSDVMDTDIEGGVTDSSVSTTGNTVQALAYGNLTDNAVTVTGTNINTEADYFPAEDQASVIAGVALTDASFSLNNAQAAGGSITATLLDGDTADRIHTEIEDGVENSSVLTNGNTLSAGATGNRADNLVDLSANTLATTGALTNFQTSEADISALIGIEGGPPTPGVPGGPFNYDITGTGLTHDGSEFLTGTLFVDTTTLDAAQLAYLDGLGFTPSGPNQVSMSAVGYAATISEFGILFGPPAGSLPLAGVASSVPASPGSPNEGGVVASINGDASQDILASTVSVNANTIAGSVTGNSAANAVVLSGANVPDGSDHVETWAIADGADTEANGDAMLANLQQVGETALDSTVYGTFAIETDEDGEIVDSTLTVDGNSQSSRVVSNTAANSVELTATNTGAGAVLASNQTSVATVNALSDVDIFAAVSSTGSSVSMSDNSNIAVGVINNATNKVTVAVTNAEPVFLPGAERDVYLDVNTEAVAFGDHVLLNQQLATTSATADANTTIYNEDGTSLATDGVVDGSVIIAGNSTTAEASANRAVNMMDVSAGSNLPVSSGITSSQMSSAAVDSSATTSAGVTLAGDGTLDAAALNGSSVTLGSNTTSALARGNAATNALNYAAGANYGDVTGDGGAYTSTTLGNATTVARAGVLNVQNNDGAVSASSTNASYVVALNSTGAATMTNATVGVIGNSVSAAGYGNTANNSIRIAALNTGMPTAAVGNVQTNTAPVTVSVASVSYGISGGYGAITGSALAVSGNAITATAIGNNAVSSIGAVN